MASDAYELITELLGPYNLPPDVIDGAWKQYLAGKTPAEILVWVRQQPSYKTAFPGIDDLRASGSPYGSEPAYAQYVQQAREQARLYGIPPELFDSPADFVPAMKGNVSPAELTNRYQMAAAAVYTVPQEVRDAMSAIAGIGTGDLVGYFLDPDRAAPLLQQRYQAAQVMGAGTMQGIGVDTDTAQRLADSGVGFEQAQQGFSQVAALRGLTAALGQGQTVDQGQLVDAILGGSQNAQAAATAVQQARRARFGASGGAAAAQSGATGLGESRTT